MDRARACANSCCCSWICSASDRPASSAFVRRPASFGAFLVSSLMCSHAARTSSEYAPNPSASSERSTCSGVIVDFLSAVAISLACADTTLTNSVQHSSSFSDASADVRRSPGMYSLISLVMVALGSEMSLPPSSAMLIELCACLYRRGRGPLRVTSEREQHRLCPW
ncbi:MAG: hypothetical protein J3K34DRAFT_407050 [Monoraphidium minutum]|nr:MAG: hypothetical protein J3K34DRAFT_407050 [Monoraphidium minutum]